MSKHLKGMYPFSVLGWVNHSQCILSALVQKVNITALQKQNLEKNTIDFDKKTPVDSKFIAYNHYCISHV